MHLPAAEMSFLPPCWQQLGSFFFSSPFTWKLESEMECSPKFIRSFLCFDLRKKPTGNYGMPAYRALSTRTRVFLKPNFLNYLHPHGTIKSASSNRMHMPVQWVAISLLTGRLYNPITRLEKFTDWINNNGNTGAAQILLCGQWSGVTAYCNKIHQNGGSVSQRTAA